MGLFTTVEIHSDLLPDPVRDLSDWQTKGLVEPVMGSIFIGPDRRVIYKEYFYKGVENPDSVFGYEFELDRVEENFISITSTFRFYTLDEEKVLWEVEGMVIMGVLVSTKLITQH